ncbi:hypothetical protein F4825DRAFT_413641 [Nemania diffusa]|nr:hypothetical protein F4825DRAFT_413641 [Nemania diffusa]
MDSRSPEYEVVPVTDDQEELSPTVQIPRSFTSEWHTSDHSPDISTKKDTLISRITPYIWFIEIAILLFIAALLTLLLLRGGRGGSPTSSRQVGIDFSGAGAESLARVVEWEADKRISSNTTTSFYSGNIPERCKI